MGYIAHDAIVVTGNDESGQLTQAHQIAKRIGLSVTEISSPITNNYQSFLICPDGSKEGWDDSDRGDSFREQWKTEVTAMHFYCIEWVHVRFADELYPHGHGAKIVDISFGEQG